MQGNGYTMTTLIDSLNVLLQVILASGTTEQELDSALQDRLAEAEHQQDTDASLNSVLVLAAQAEIDQLRNVITTSAQVRGFPRVRPQCLQNHSMLSACGWQPSEPQSARVILYMPTLLEPLCCRRKKPLWMAHMKQQPSLQVSSRL